MPPSQETEHQTKLLEHSQYGFDRDSRRTWQKRPLTDMQDLHHDYDALSQVTSSARGSLNLNTTAISGIPAYAESWNYDPTGNWREYQTSANRESMLDQHRVHDRGNRLTQIEDSPTAMVLDRAGRMRQMSPDAGGDWNGKLELTWDAWGRITKGKNNGTEVGTYQYDGLTRRTTRTIGSVKTHTYYSDAWRPLEDRAVAGGIDPGTPSAQYLWGARHRDDLVRRDRATTTGGALNETRYMLMDYFSPAAITDQTGVVRERYAFSAFGVRSILNPDFTSRTTSENAFEFAFQGQFLDTESGLYNYGYRYYSPYLGRWTCKDPIEEKGGSNLYEMASNQTPNFVDYLGLISFSCIGFCVDQCRFASRDPNCQRDCIAWKKDPKNCPCGADDDEEKDDGGGGGGGGADCSREERAYEAAQKTAGTASRYMNEAKEVYERSGRNKNTAIGAQLGIEIATELVEGRVPALEHNLGELAGRTIDDLVDRSKSDFEKNRAVYAAAKDEFEAAAKVVSEASLALAECYNNGRLW